MTAKNELTPFLVLVSIITTISVAALAAGAIYSGEILALGFVLFMAALPAWAIYFGVRSGCIRRPGEPAQFQKAEEPAEKASCATTLSA